MSMEWEDRYLVIKRKNIKPEDAQKLYGILNEMDLPEVSCVVVETDWPEFDPVCKMIEDRVKGEIK